MFASKYFNVGQVVVTHGINNIMTKNERFALEVALCLKRFCIKDFGNLSDEDKQVNEESLKYPDDLYLLGSYQTCAGKNLDNYKCNGNSWDECHNSVVS